MYQPFLANILEKYNDFKFQALKNRVFTPEEVQVYLHDLSDNFEVTQIGLSVENRPICSVKWGNGKIKVFAWSQMHGDEATGTMSLFDLFAYLDTDDETVNLLKENLELHFIPMVNPDGAHYFTRRNAQLIDINRDYTQCLSPEANILKSYFLKIKPDFGFNLHDQDTLWGIQESRLPATLSFLSPVYDASLAYGKGRLQAAQVIAEVFETISPILPGQMGLFEAEYEPRAFGDNFQALDCATILLEAGGFPNDYEKQEIRKLYFFAILTGLISIAKKSYQSYSLEQYKAIPFNAKPLFHLMVRNIQLSNVKACIGLNYKEYLDKSSRTLNKCYYVEDVGDLSPWAAYKEITGQSLSLKGEITFGALANFEIFDEEKRILGFKDGYIY